MNVLPFENGYYIPDVSHGPIPEFIFPQFVTERSDNHVEAHQDPFELHPGDDGRDLFHRRRRRSDRREVKNMDGLANLISMLDYVLDTTRKRHITGGILLSVSMLFGSLAITVMTLKNDETTEEEFEYEQGK